jgi:hypothetical protein
MTISVEQISEEALSLPSEARRRIDEVCSGAVATIDGEDAFRQVRAAVAR